ncbi:MAG: DUF2213 domain-containing protein [Myxococcales bacterium]|nr:DUF2213 domain-containing protein [Myxococcales bacterium]
MEIIRFDFNGSPTSFKRTPQGFLRVKARLSKTGVFAYHNGREYRSEEEVFRADSLASLKGAPVTDLHPSEKGFDGLLTPSNAKEHIVGITEDVERDGHYVRGSLLIFHQDAIEAIEKGERKEISLGYKCRLEPTQGTVNGETYDSIQRDIIVNHVAIGPKGWGRAGPDCAIRTDSQMKQGENMTEVIRVDGLDVAFTKESISLLLDEKKRQYEELRGRLDAIGLELEKEKAVRAALEDPKTVESKLQSRLKLVEKCRGILGDEAELEGKTDDELKFLGIQKFYPSLDLEGKDQSYLDGMFEAIVCIKSERNDSLSSTRQALQRSSEQSAYESWLKQSAKLWSIPLNGSLR